MICFGKPTRGKVIFEFLATNIRVYYLNGGNFHTV